MASFEYNKEDGWQHFRDWMVKHHAILLPPTNAYEIFRADTRMGMLVGYRNRKGKNSFSSPEAQELFEAYSRKSTNAPASLSPEANKRHDIGSAKRRKLLKSVMARDGDGCFFCEGRLRRPYQHADLSDPTRTDATLDHFLPVSKGGPNNLHNYVAACRPCNAEADAMGIVEKVKFRDRKRGRRT